MMRFVTKERRLFVYNNKIWPSFMDSPENVPKGQKDLRSMLLNNRASSSGTSTSSKDADSSALITEENFKRLFPDGYQRRKPFQRPTNHWAMSRETFKSQALEHDQVNYLNLASWLEWQRTLQKTVNIGHSKDSEFLSDILQKCDAKRLESTQMNQPPVFNTQELVPQNVVAPVLPSPVKTTKQTKKKQKQTTAKSPGKNYGDIRALFSTATKSTKNYTKLINDLGIQNNGSVPTSLLNLLVDLNLNVDNTNNSKKCYVCQNICDCQMIKNLRKSHGKPENLKKFLADPVIPDLDLIDGINSETIMKCKKGNEANHNILKCDISNITGLSRNDKGNCSTNFDLELDLDTLDEIKMPSPLAKDTAKINVSCDKNFDLGDIDDIFADSSPEEAIEKTIKTAKNVEIANEVEDKPTGTQEALGFFGLDSIDDIFADYEDDVKESLNLDNCKDNANCSEKAPVKESEVVRNKPKETDKKKIIEPDTVPNAVYPLSPSILTGKQAVKEITTSQTPTSPILCSQQQRKFQLSTKKKQINNSTPKSSVKRKLLQPELDNNNVIVIDDDKDYKAISNSVADVTDKSMFTITQIVEMINKTNEKSMKESENPKTDVSKRDRSMSPILLTQADRKRSTNLSSSKIINKINDNKSKSLIILDSDSDSEDTQSYNIDEEMSKINDNVNKDHDGSQIGGKRKFEEDSFSIASSPYFNKKPKLDNVTAKSLTLQEKVLAALTSNKAKESEKNKDNNPWDSPKKTTNKPQNNNHTNFQVTVSPPHIFSQKENFNPLEVVKGNIFDDKEIKLSPLDTLQKYRKESKLRTLRSKFDVIFKKSPKKLHESPKKNNNIFEESDDFLVNDRLSSPINKASNSNKENTPAKRKIYFDESDEDFVGDDKINCHSPKKPSNHRKEIRSMMNQKVRKKKRPRNAFIEMEASLSDDGSDSGDELSDDSVGSIADFIDDNDMTRQEEDIRAIYMKSVRSPVKKNGFKIPELPKKYKREDIFSQFVEEDAYEMDSFCVDSHIGLTQVNDVSELELAEIVLEEKRRSKKKGKQPPTQTNGDSPLIRKVNKNCKKRIQSDSDDSS